MYTQDINTVVSTATTKAVMHSIIVPSIIFITFFVFKTEWAGLSFLYWILPMIVYTFSKSHDFTRKIFFRIIASIIAFVLVFALLLVS